ncbi:MAG: hypothetical protein SPE01_06155, partial [Candidatus Spyradocola sp.]|nr:hypothetical protein [Candidatus Spyradocola sp.]
NSRTALPHTNFSVSEAIFHLQIVRERMEKRSHPSFILPNVQKIAPRRGTRPRLRIEDEGAAAPSCIPGEHMPVF